MEARKGAEEWPMVRARPNALGDPYPWYYGTHCLQGKTWVELPEGDKVELIQFLKRLASVLPDTLWPDLDTGKSLDTSLGMCCDIRLLNFSPSEFDRPEVFEFISRSVRESREKLSEIPESTDGLLSLPIANYDFGHFAEGNLDIEVCWYANIDFIRWPKPDILRIVPDAEEIKQKINGLAKLAGELVPEASLLDTLHLPPRPPERQRPSFERRLDGSTLDDVRSTLAGLIEPAHDLALSVFQGWLDQIKGEACPLFQDNQRLASMVTEQSDRYGFRLYIEYKGELVEVRVDSKFAHASNKTNPGGAAALAGNFAIRTHNQPKVKSTFISTLATFPPLIAARDREQANRFWEERKRQAAS